MEIENRSLRLFLCNSGPELCVLHSHTFGNTIVLLVYGECPIFLFLTNVIFYYLINN